MSNITPINRIIKRIENPLCRRKFLNNSLQMSVYGYAALLGIPEFYKFNTFKKRNPIFKDWYCFDCNQFFDITEIMDSIPWRNSIIKRNLDYFAAWIRGPISEVEQEEKLRQLLDRLDPKHPLKHLKGEIYKMKEESWSPQYISQCICDYLHDPPKREGYIYKVSSKKMGCQKGDLKQHLIEAEKGKITELHRQFYAPWRKIRCIYCGSRREIGRYHELIEAKQKKQVIKRI